MLNQANILDLIPVVFALLIFVWFVTQRYSRKIIHAERQAELLLRDILTPRELRQLFWRNYVEIPSKLRPQRVYRVPRTNSYVQVRENGRTIMWLCLQPIEQLPDDDVVVMHKLMIEGQEEVYLQTANKFRYFDTFTEL